MDTDYFIEEKIFRSIIIIFVAGFIVIQGFLIGFKNFWSPDTESKLNPSEYRVIESSKDIEHLWIQENIYASNSSKGGVLLDSTDEGVYFLSRFEDNDIYGLSLIKFDLLSGEVVWRTLDNRPAPFGDPSPTELTTNTNNIFIAIPGTQKISGEMSFGTAKLESYDFDGNSVWLRSVNGARSITTMVATDNTVSIDGSFSSNYYLLDANSGKVLNKTPKENGKFIWFIENGVRYEQNEFLIQAVELSNEAILWQNKINEQIFMAPVFSDQHIILRTDKAQFLGTAIALGKDTGEIIWEYPDVLTNIAVDNFVAYFLTADMRLVGIDIETGSTLLNIDFEPNEALDAVNNVYQITAINDIIVVYFGGTKQLSAYRPLVEN
ncbi:MAG: hypothetical protein DWQ04_11555 [Chloroflexi bacterium]|nr:MAG: hypothetical protein DWQ04_11555 [Chloroflexota bacterium]